MRRGLDENFNGTDPLGFIIAQNEVRRHLEFSQRSLIAARLATLECGGDSHSFQPKKSESGYAKAKREAKISDTQAHRWQKLAGILDMNQADDFERSMGIESAICGSPVGSESKLRYSIDQQFLRKPTLL